MSLLARRHQAEVVSPSTATPRSHTPQNVVGGGQIPAGRRSPSVQGGANSRGHSRSNSVQPTGPPQVPTLAIPANLLSGRHRAVDREESRRPLSSRRSAQRRSLSPATTRSATGAGGGITARSVRHGSPPSTAVASGGFIPAFAQDVLHLSTSTPLLPQHMMRYVQMHTGKSRDDIPELESFFTHGRSVVHTMPNVFARCMTLVNGEMWIGERNGAISRWGAHDAELIQRAERTNRSLLVCCMMPVGLHVWCGISDGTLRILHPTDATRVVREVKEHAGAITCMELSHNEHYVFTGSSDFIVTQWSATEGLRVQALAGHHAAVRCLRAVGIRLFSGADDGKIIEWDVTRGKVLHTLAGHKSAVRCLQASTLYLWSGGDDATLRVWLLQNNTDAPSWVTDAPSIAAAAAEGDSLEDLQRAMNQQRTSTMTAIRDAKHHRRQRASGSAIATELVPPHGDVVSSPSTTLAGIIDARLPPPVCQHMITHPFTSGVTHLQTVGNKIWSVSLGTVYVWNNATFALEAQFREHEGMMSALHTVRQSVLSRVWTAGAEGNVLLWNVECNYQSALQASSDLHTAHLEHSLEQHFLREEKLAAEALIHRTGNERLSHDITRLQDELEELRRAKMSSEASLRAELADLEAVVHARDATIRDLQAECAGYVQRLGVPLSGREMRMKLLAEQACRGVPLVAETSHASSKLEASLEALAMLKQEVDTLYRERVISAQTKMAQAAERQAQTVPEKKRSKQHLRLSSTDSSPPASVEDEAQHSVPSPSPPPPPDDVRAQLVEPSSFCVQDFAVADCNRLREDLHRVYAWCASLQRSVEELHSACAVVLGSSQGTPSAAAAAPEEAHDHALLSSAILVMRSSAAGRRDGHGQRWHSDASSPSTPLNVNPSREVEVAEESLIVDPDGFGWLSLEEFDEADRQRALTLLHRGVCSLRFQTSTSQGVMLTNKDCWKEDAPNLEHGAQPALALLVFPHWSVLSNDDASWLLALAPRYRNQFDSENPVEGNPWSCHLPRALTLLHDNALAGRWRPSAFSRRGDPPPDTATSDDAPAPAAGLAFSDHGDARVGIIGYQRVVSTVSSTLSSVATTISRISQQLLAQDDSLVHQLRVREDALRTSRALLTGHTTSERVSEDRVGLLKDSEILELVEMVKLRLRTTEMDRMQAESAFATLREARRVMSETRAALSEEHNLIGDEDGGVVSTVLGDVVAVTSCDDASLGDLVAAAVRDTQSEENLLCKAAAECLRLRKEEAAAARHREASLQEKLDLSTKSCDAMRHALSGVRCLADRLEDDMRGYHETSRELLLPTCAQNVPIVADREEQSGSRSSSSSSTSSSSSDAELEHLRMMQEASVRRIAATAADETIAQQSNVTVCRVRDVVAPAFRQTLSDALQVSAERKAAVDAVERVVKLLSDTMGCPQVGPYVLPPGGQEETVDEASTPTDVAPLLILHRLEALACTLCETSVSLGERASALSLQWQQSLGEFRKEQCIIESICGAAITNTTCEEEPAEQHERRTPSLVAVKEEEAKAHLDFGNSPTGIVARPQLLHLTDGNASASASHSASVDLCQRLASRLADVTAAAQQQHAQHEIFRRAFSVVALQWIQRLRAPNPLPLPTHVDELLENAILTMSLNSEVGALDAVPSIDEIFPQHPPTTDENDSPSTAEQLRGILVALDHVIGSCAHQSDKWRDSLLSTHHRPIGVPSFVDVTAVASLKEALVELSSVRQFARDVVHAPAAEHSLSPRRSRSARKSLILGSSLLSDEGVTALRSPNVSSLGATPERVLLALTPDDDLSADMDPMESLCSLIASEAASVVSTLRDALSVIELHRTTEAKMLSSLHDAAAAFPEMMAYQHLTPEQPDDDTADLVAEGGSSQMRKLDMDALGPLMARMMQEPRWLAVCEATRRRAREAAKSGGHAGGIEELLLLDAERQRKAERKLQRKQHVYQNNNSMSFSNRPTVEATNSTSPFPSPPLQAAVPPHLENYSIITSDGGDSATVATMERAEQEEGHHASTGRRSLLIDDFCHAPIQLLLDQRSVMQLWGTLVAAFAREQCAAHAEREARLMRVIEHLTRDDDTTRVEEGGGVDHRAGSPSALNIHSRSGMAPENLPGWFTNTSAGGAVPGVDTGFTGAETNTSCSRQQRRIHEDVDGYDAASPPRTGPMPQGQLRASAHITSPDVEGASVKKKHHRHKIKLLLSPSKIASPGSSGDERDEKDAWVPPTKDAFYHLTAQLEQAQQALALLRSRYAHLECSEAAEEGPNDVVSAQSPQRRVGLTNDSRPHSPHSALADPSRLLRQVLPLLQRYHTLLRTGLSYTFSHNATDDPQQQEGQQLEKPHEPACGAFGETVQDDGEVAHDNSASASSSGEEVDDSATSTNSDDSLPEEALLATFDVLRRELLDVENELALRSNSDYISLLNAYATLQQRYRAVLRSVRGGLLLSGVAGRNGDDGSDISMTSTVESENEDTTTNRSSLRSSAGYDVIPPPPREVYLLNMGSADNDDALPTTCEPAAALARRRQLEETETSFIPEEETAARARICADHAEAMENENLSRRDRLDAVQAVKRLYHLMRQYESALRHSIAAARGVDGDLEAQLDAEALDDDRNVLAAGIGRATDEDSSDVGVGALTLEPSSMGSFMERSQSFMSVGGRSSVGAMNRADSEMPTLLVASATQLHQRLANICSSAQRGADRLDKLLSESDAQLSHASIDVLHTCNLVMHKYTRSLDKLLHMGSIPPPWRPKLSRNFRSILDGGLEGEPPEDDRVGAEVDNTAAANPQAPLSASSATGPAPLEVLRIQRDLHQQLLRRMHIVEAEVEKHKPHLRELPTYSSWASMLKKDVEALESIGKEAAPPAPPRVSQLEPVEDSTDGMDPTGVSTAPTVDADGTSSTVPAYPPPALRVLHAHMNAQLAATIGNIDRKWQQRVAAQNSLLGLVLQKLQAITPILPMTGGPDPDKEGEGGKEGCGVDAVEVSNNKRTTTATTTTTTEEPVAASLLQRTLSTLSSPDAGGGMKKKKSMRRTAGFSPSKLQGSAGAPDGAPSPPTTRRRNVSFVVADDAASAAVQSSSRWPMILAEESSLFQRAVTELHELGLRSINLSAQHEMVRGQLKISDLSVATLKDQVHSLLEELDASERLVQTQQGELTALREFKREREDTISQMVSLSTMTDSRIIESYERLYDESDNARRQLVRQVADLERTNSKLWVVLQQHESAGGGAFSMGNLFDDEEGDSKTPVDEAEEEGGNGAAPVEILDNVSDVAVADSASGFTDSAPAADGGASSSLADGRASEGSTGGPALHVVRGGAAANAGGPLPRYMRGTAARNTSPSLGGRDGTPIKRTVTPSPVRRNSPQHRSSPNPQRPPTPAAASAGASRPMMSGEVISSAALGSRALLAALSPFDAAPLLTKASETIRILREQLADIEHAAQHHRDDFAILVPAGDADDEDDVPGLEDTNSRREWMQRIRRYEQVRFAQWGDHCRLSTELHNTYQYVSDILLQSLKRLHRLGFLVETRPPLLKATYEIYTVLLLCIRSITGFAKLTNEGKLSRREALGQVDRIADEVATATEGAAWMLANLFTDDELAHVGASPHLLPPDVRRPTWREIKLPSHYQHFMDALAAADRSISPSRQMAAATVLTPHKSDTTLGPRQRTPSRHLTDTAVSVGKVNSTRGSVTSTPPRRQQLPATPGSPHFSRR